MDGSRVVLVATLVVLSFHCACCSYDESSFQMLSHDQPYMVDVGAKLELKCQFRSEKFNLFENPVQWKKWQYGDESEINILGNIKEPFESAGRFSVTYLPEPPQHTVKLTIENMHKVDSANYTCEVRAPRSNPLGSVHYVVFVKAAVEEAYIIQGNTTTTPYDESVPTLTFIENHPTPLRCIARGGSPPPEMRIEIGGDDYTRYFRAESEPGLSGSTSFKTLQMTSMLVRDDFRASAKDDGKRLNCIAKVTGMPRVVSSARIVVNHVPRMDCQPVVAEVGDRNVRIVCDVTARPALTSWHWVLDGNGTTVSEGEVIDGYWTVVTKSDGKVTLELYVRETTSHSFRRYTLVAENPVATQAVQVALEKRRNDAEPEPHAENDPQREKHASPYDRGANTFSTAPSTNTVNILLLMTIIPGIIYHLLH